MLALSIVPGRSQSVELGEHPEEPVPEGWLEVDALAVGMCGTDREIIEGAYGEAPPGEQRLVLGHESLGRVRRAPRGSGAAPGDLVVGIVRRPDPVPCASCNVGEWDMCENGLFTEHGIKGLHGFCRERYALDPAFAVRLESGMEDVGVLLEPTSVVVKAWEQITRIGARAAWQPQRVLVTGAGPIGLLAAWIGQGLGFEVHVFDRVTGGAKPALVRELGATFHAGEIESLGGGWDIILECTGAAPVVLAALEMTTRSGILCLTGLSTGRRVHDVDVGLVNRRMVLENDVVFGSVNSNRRHYEAGAKLLARGDRAWLARLITARLMPEDWAQSLDLGPEDVKAVIDFTL